MRTLLETVRKFLLSVIARLNPIHYISTSETLPEPLTADEEADAIARLEMTPDIAKEARKKLVEHNLRLVVYIARRFENTGAELEDLISIGTIGLIKAVGSFRADKGIKLATYASRCIENEILMYIRKCSQRRGEVSIDEPLNVDWDGNELLLSDVIQSEDDDIWKGIEADEDKRAIHSALAGLDERERVIIELRFGLRGGDELTQKEVAKLLGISQSYISRLEKRVIERLKEVITA